MSSFTKAQRHKKRLKLAVSGPTGSGKTRTALALMSAIIGDNIMLIDTENSRAEMFSGGKTDLVKGQFLFNVAILKNYNPLKYIELINEAEKGGATGLIIDSLTHAWSGEGGVLDLVSASTGSNKYTDGWGKVGTPMQTKLMGAILKSQMHIIATMRSDMDYVLVNNIPKKMGMKPTQRKDVEYEFDIHLAMDMDHTARIEKIPPIYDYKVGQVIQSPATNPKFISDVMAWLAEGEDALAVAESDPAVTLPGGAKAPTTKATMDYATMWALVNKSDPDGKIKRAALALKESGKTAAEIVAELKL